MLAHVSTRATHVPAVTRRTACFWDTPQALGALRTWPYTEVLKSLDRFFVAIPLSHKAMELRLIQEPSLTSAHVYLLPSKLTGQQSTLPSSTISVPHDMGMATHQPTINQSFCTDIQIREILECACASVPHKNGVANSVSRTIQNSDDSLLCQSVQTSPDHADPKT